MEEEFINKEGVCIKCRLRQKMTEPYEFVVKEKLGKNGRDITLLKGVGEKCGHRMSIILKNRYKLKY